MHAARRAILTFPKYFVFPKSLLYLNYEEQRRFKTFQKMPDMKKYLLSVAVAMVLCGFAATAQQTEKNPDAKPKKETGKDKKLKEYDEIVIKRKDLDKDAKVTIEIKGDKVIVDGKPIEEYNDDELSIQQRDANRFKLVNPRSPFRFEDGDWSTDEMDLMDEGGDRPFLGVTTEGTTDGVRIINVSENSAAAKAGLKKGDIITMVNDKKVFDHEQLTEAIAAFKPDDKVKITYKREGREDTTTATLGKRKDGLIARGPRGAMAPPPPMVFNFDDGDFGDVFQYHNARPRLGLKVQDTEDGKGVKVLEVEEGSAAEKAGIKEDDVITSFEGKDVTSASDLARASRDVKDKSSMKVQLNRNGKLQTIEVKVPKKLRTANL
jgi:serine protease Do